MRGRGYVEIARTFPQPGWVEQDAAGDLGERRDGGRRGARGCARARRPSSTAIGITNQRETTILWERATGRPVANAIVWQDRRTAERCRELPAALIRERTGLVPDPYFSATKLEWLLARVDAAARRARVRHGRQLARLEAHRRPRPRDRPDERVAHDALRHRRGSRGTTSCSRCSASTVRCCPRSFRAPASSARRSCSARRCRSRGSSATSRRRSSARAASRRARRRRRTGRARSCS